jgi:hypothetical protein
MKKEGGREVGSAVVVTAKIPFCQTLLPKKVPGFRTKIHNPMKDIEHRKSIKSFTMVLCINQTIGTAEFG